MNIKDIFAALLLIRATAFAIIELRDVRESGVRNPPCYFNGLCTCSQAGPDLGLVQCNDVPILDLPIGLNVSKVFVLRLNRAGIRKLTARRLESTGLWRLDLRHNSISRIGPGVLDGLERSLWELDLGFNRLRTVPQPAISALKKLRVMDLTGNKIGKLSKQDFRGLEATLQVLILSNNLIATLPMNLIKDLLHLESLDLSSNRLLNINEQAFHGAPTTFSSLNLADNYLYKIPFYALESVKSLKVLRMDRNRISSTFDVFFQGKMSLDIMTLDENSIEGPLQPYSFQNFAMVNKTFLRGNRIKRISNDAFKGTVMREINLFDCGIREIGEKAFHGLENVLQSLDLGNNEIQFLPRQALQDFDKLKNLSLQGNRMFSNPNGTFVNLRYTLQHINLVGEEMKKIRMRDLQNMRNIRTLGYSSLSVLSKEEFEGIGPAIQELDLRSSDIVKIEDNAFRTTPGLKSLDLKYNKIREIQPHAFDDVGHSLERLNLREALSMTTIAAEVFQPLAILRNLDLSNNRLDSIPQQLFRNLENLEVLNVQDNRIHSLHKDTFKAEHHKNLRTISLSFNDLERVDEGSFVGLSKLEHLYISDNRIETLERGAFSDLESLTYLDLDGNEIVTLQSECFQNLPKIQDLSLAFNSLTYVNLDAFDQIGTMSSLSVDVSHNKINVLQNNGSIWLNSPSIQRMDFSFNNISYIQNYFQPLRNSLFQLRVTNNKLEVLTRFMFGDLYHLHILALDHNQIHAMFPEAFSGSTQIQILTLSHNFIHDLPAVLFINLPSLRVLDLSGNYLNTLPSSIFANCRIEKLTFSNNLFVVLPELALFPLTRSLKFLDFSHNRISHVGLDSFQHFAELVSVNLADNGLLGIADGTFAFQSNLLSLDISHNPIQSSLNNAFVGLQDGLEELNIANTRRTSIPRTGFSNLVKLNVSHNFVNVLSLPTITNFTSVYSLDLSYNDISQLDDINWNLLPNLKTLNVSHNPVTLVSNDSFYGLDKLDEIDVTGLPVPTGALGTLKYLRVLHISNFEVEKVKISDLTLQNSALTALHLTANNSHFETKLGNNLSPKLQEIRISGENLTDLPENLFQQVRSRHVKIGIYDTGISSLSPHLFENMKSVRYLDVEFNNNSLKSIPKNANRKPDLSKNAFLWDLKIDSNQFECDCGIGWVEDWSRRWRHQNCGAGDDVQRYSLCRQMLRNLRLIECPNYDNRTLVDVMKTELECPGSANSLLKGKITLISLLIWALLFLKCFS